MSNGTGEQAASALDHSDVTPLLTPATLERVRQGVEAARHPEVRRHIQEALEEIGAIAEGKPDPRVSGSFRRWVMRRWLKALFHIQIENPEYIPKESVVLVGNHLGHIDPFLLLAVVPPTPYYYILGDARTLYNQSWKRWLAGWAGGVIPLERWWKEELAVIAAAKAGQDDLQPLANDIEQHVPNGSSIQQLRQIDESVQAILKRGDSLLLFPEGRLGSQEGQLHLPLKRGTVIYAIRSGVPIVPVALIGTQNLYFRKTLTVRFGKPLPLGQSKRPKRQEIDAALAQVEQALLALLPAQYQEPAGIKLFQGWLNHLFW
ncbi:MAG: 1-acyl-sn-glycerol-3-phosphate acyltransferase [Cyanobacteria bacterium Co-bin8]|nr:1-acyl-sn-glycerol-3-phosphate acyltransferase [Cyanobacteria bacterium Co-bin8]